MDLPIPDTSAWQPREKAAETLSKAFYLRCLQTEELILKKTASEIDCNIDSFDSGLGVEDIIRQSLEELLPKRYTVTSGLINDCLGRTSGESDIVIFNEIWFPAVKAGATEKSKRRHFPIEGVYATLEVKQTISQKTLDEAFEKLVCASRLFRPVASKDYITENRIIKNSDRYTSNSLFTGIIATNLDKSVSVDEVILRFIKINQKLPRNHMVRSLCVLGKFSCFWGYESSDQQNRPAFFQGEDLDFPLHIIKAESDRGYCPFYYLIYLLLMHCTHSVLTPESFGVAYGLVSPILSSMLEPNFIVSPTGEHLHELSESVIDQYINRKRADFDRRDE